MDSVAPPRERAERAGMVSWHADPVHVEPGDLVLVQSPGRFFGVVRRLGGNPYDHVAVVVDDGLSVNIDKPAARTLPVERLLRESLHPLVLRPRFASEDERTRFVAAIEQLLRAPYDVRRTLWLVERLLEQRLLGRARPLPPLGWDRERWICTDAVLLGLERHVSGFAALREMPLDWVAIGSGTTNDLLTIHRARPDLLAEIRPFATRAPVSSGRP